MFLHCVRSTWVMSLWNRNIYLVNWKTLLRPYAVRIIHVANVSFSNYFNNLWFARFEAQRPRVQHQSNVLIPYEWRLYENSSVLFRWMEILWAKKSVQVMIYLRICKFSSFSEDLRNKMRSNRFAVESQSENWPRMNNANDGKQITAQRINNTHIVIR